MYLIHYFITLLVLCTLGQATTESHYSNDWSANDTSVHAFNNEIERLRHEVISLRSEVKRMQNEIAKNAIAPFDCQSNSNCTSGSSLNANKSDSSIPMGVRKRILVTGGAGFVGSHLVDRLIQMGCEVIVVDNFVTGQSSNLRHLKSHPRLEIVRQNVEQPLHFNVDQIYHLASPASPPQYMRDPVRTLRTNALGTLNALDLAHRENARVLLASTSEVYGDPLQHPQSESYWGNVNPFGPRSCYDEGKRFAEALSYGYMVSKSVHVRIARIFNTYGPRMQLKDGRVVSNFIVQALQGVPLTVYGTGKQTRSFQYISDLIDGLILLMESNVTTPVNLGNPVEYRVEDFAHQVLKSTASNSKLIYLPALEDDPKVRRPNITLAQNSLQWHPKVPLHIGLRHTIDYFRQLLNM